MVDQAASVIRTNEISLSTEAERLLILLAVPAQDRLTDYAVKLLEDFPNLGAPTLLCNIKSPLTYDELLSQNSINPVETNVAMVFCGHGLKDSLLGPSPQAYGRHQTSQSAFFDQSHIAIGPKYLLAFCSNAASELGDAYDRITTDRTFIGFEDEIGLVLAAGVYAEWWQRILHGLTSAMLTSPNIAGLEKSISALYTEAISFFSTGDGRNHTWALMMRVYLRRQLEAIRIIQT